MEDCAIEDIMRLDEVALINSVIDKLPNLITFICRR